MPRILLLLALGCVATSLHAAQSRLIDSALEDHRKVEYSPEQWNGRRLMLFLADRKGSEYDRNHVWTSPVAHTARGLAPGLGLASIADLRGTPRLARGLVRGMFEPEAQDPVGLTLLDWDGEFFKAYDLEPGAFHLLVFDEKHALVYRVALHEFDTAQLAVIQNALKKLWPQ